MSQLMPSTTHAKINFSMSLNPSKPESFTAGVAGLVWGLPWGSVAALVAVRGFTSGWTPPLKGGRLSNE